MNTKEPINRRDFLKFTGLASAILAVGYYTPVGSAMAQVVNLDKLPVEGVQLNHFIFIAPSGKVTLVNHRPEMGQGVYQAMPMLLAEELEVDIETIEVIQGHANKPAYGHQQVGGSSSVRKSWEPSRKMGAAAREMLIKAAAQQWGTDVAQCYAENGHVIHKNTKAQLGYGALVEAASKLDAPDSPTLKPAKDFKILGKPIARKDIPLKTNGTAMFGLDLKVPDMLYASVARCPVFVGKVKDYDDTAALQVPGVRKVVKSQMAVFSHTREGVAVIADSYWAALQGRKALKVNWDKTPHDQVSQSSIYQSFREASKQKGQSLYTHGDFETHFAKATQQLSAIYECPYQAHAPMEPMNAIVSVTPGKCEFWGPLQSPNWIRGVLAKHLDIPEEQVTVNISFLGGGFGRRAFTDFALEAANLSEAVGKPVKVVWTREDDTTQGPFRPGTVNAMKAGFDKAGNTLALENKVVCQDMGHQWPGADTSKASGSIKEGIMKDYEIPHMAITAVPQTTHIPVMWWRAVYSSTNGFAHEGFMDEMAHAVGQDPLEYRLSMLKESPRASALLQKLAQISDWNTPPKAGEGKGVALVESFGSICGQVVYVKRVEGKMKVDKVYAVVDCGQTVNPNTIAAQIEGSIVMGLTAAYKSEITFDKGCAVERNFDKFKMLRINECPEIETHIMQNEEAPGGVGEPGLPPVAPALTNAIFAATGKRIRKLPFDLNTI